MSDARSERADADWLWLIAIRGGKQRYSFNRYVALDGPGSSGLRQRWCISSAVPTKAARQLADHPL